MTGDDYGLQGLELPPDGVDLARQLQGWLDAHPEDTAAKEEIRTLLTDMQDTGAHKPLEWSTWADHPDQQPVRRWLVEDWLPAGRVSLFAGSGGIGKSRLVLQKAAGIATGGGAVDEWIDVPDPQILRLGKAVPAGGAPVVYASWEDEPEEIYRRLAEISGPSTPWVTPPSLSALRVYDMAGRGPVWAPESGRHISTLAEITQVGQELRQHCEDAGARLLILDPLAAAYTGDENARGLVRLFVSDWDAWGRKNECAVLLVAHPPKSGADYAGSTDWQGAVRSMWSLTKEKLGAKPKHGEDTRLDGWKLSLVKSNYGPPQRSLELVWDSAGDTPQGTRHLCWRVAGLWTAAGRKSAPVTTSSQNGAAGYDLGA